MYADRIKNYHYLENEFEGKVLSYITSDRTGFETQIAQDVIDLFIDQLDCINVADRIILYLYTRGGDIAVAWNIVNLLRMYCDDLIVVVPHKAHSAGTVISLGANKIIMTKQATLSPIDPSIITPLNPAPPINPATALPVSVEAVNGYIELAQSEFGLKDEDAMSKILIKLSEYVHPLVLGQVYRSRDQIRKLAGQLLANQIGDEKARTKLIEFLCGDSGSHDYTINRREAKNKWGLAIEKPNDEQYRIIKSIYDNFAIELGFGQAIDPRVQGAFAVRRGFIESIAGGSDYFVTEGKMEHVILPDGQPAVQSKTDFEGWRHEQDSVDSPREISMTTERGEVLYEQDDTFKL